MTLLRNPEWQQGKVVPIRERAPDFIIPLEHVKQAAVESALILCEGNITLAAKYLRISRASMFRWVKKFRQQNQIEAGGA